LNYVIDEDLIHHTENTTGNAFEYYNLSIIIENTDAKQILLKEKNININGNKTTSTAVVIGLHYDVVFDFIAPIKDHSRKHNKVYEFPSLPTLKAIENEMIRAFQNSTNMDQISATLITRFQEEFKYLEQIEYHGYERGFPNLWQTESQSNGPFSLTLITLRNIIFIFNGIFLFGFFLYRFKLRRYRNITSNPTCCDS